MKPMIRNATIAVCVLVATPLIVSCAANSAHKSTGEYIDDAAITAKVKNELLQDKSVSGLRVSVETYKGRVQLSGFVSSQDEKIKAEKLARGVPGVISVTNDLIVQAN